MNARSQSNQVPRRHLGNRGRIDARLAKYFGTPLHVFVPSVLAGKLRDFSAALQRRFNNPLLTYSIKTNPLQSVVQTCAKLGAPPEVIAGYEMDLVDRWKLISRDLVVNGPMKTHAELERAIDWGCYINVDSIEEFRALNELGRVRKQRCKVGMRLNVKAEGEPYGRFGFGVDSGEALSVAKFIKARLRNLKLTGLHCHVGTNVADTEIYRHASVKMCRFGSTLLESKLMDLEYIDFGGGFASKSYSLSTATTPWIVPSFESYTDAMAFGIESELAGRRPRVIIEPGRALVDEAFFSLTAVRSLRSGSRREAVVDLGVNSLPSLLYRKHCFSKSSGAESTVHCYRLSGPTCLGFDILSKEVSLPRLRLGDVINISDTGAYNIAQEYPFSRFPPPVVELTQERATLIRPQTTTDAFARMLSCEA